MSRGFIVQIARGDYEAFKKKGNLYFGECFLDYENNKLYVGSENKEEPYVLDLEKAVPTPLNVGRLSLDFNTNNVKSISESLYKDWQEFLEWRKNEKEKEGL